MEDGDRLNWGIYKPSNTKENTRSWQRGLEQILPWSLQKKSALLTPPVKTSGPQTCCFKPPVYGHVLWQPQETHILGVPRIALLRAMFAAGKFQGGNGSLWAQCSSAGIQPFVWVVPVSHMPQWDVGSGYASMMGAPWSLIGSLMSSASTHETGMHCGQCISRVVSGDTSSTHPVVIPPSFLCSTSSDFTSSLYKVFVSYFRLWCLWEKKRGSICGYMCCF